MITEITVENPICKGCLARRTNGYCQVDPRLPFEVSPELPCHYANVNGVRGTKTANTFTPEESTIRLIRRPFANR